MARLELDKLREVFERAQSYSFTILRELAFSKGYFFNRVVIDIGDVFHNHRSKEYDDSRRMMLQDLLGYEEWIYSLMELRGDSNMFFVDGYTLSELLEDIKVY